MKIKLLKYIYLRLCSVLLISLCFPYLSLSSHHFLDLKSASKIVIQQALILCCQVILDQGVGICRVGNGGEFK
ncbi:hypothetical protein L2E82_03911 [Cichorium intybus]|uniref:Uncharacterized protein n=1 Tax=Cichorium intybus TaxID=13427 RepID=A0ACB9H4R1_CICIN|nr:hypothetical protein L2E82_03911 [Cichorium intybus]